MLNELSNESWSTYLYQYFFVGVWRFDVSHRYILNAVPTSVSSGSSQLAALVPFLFYYPKSASSENKSNKYK